MVGGAIASQDARQTSRVCAAYSLWGPAMKNGPRIDPDLCVTVACALWKMRRHGGSPRWRGKVTHERQRDSDGLGAIFGEIAATVAQAWRRGESAGSLRRSKRFET